MPVKAHFFRNRKKMLVIHIFLGTLSYEHIYQSGSAAVQNGVRFYMPESHPKIPKHRSNEMKMVISCRHTHMPFIITVVGSFLLESLERKKIHDMFVIGVQIFMYAYYTSMWSSLKATQTRIYLFVSCGWFHFVLYQKNWKGTAVNMLMIDRVFMNADKRTLSHVICHSMGV